MTLLTRLREMEEKATKGPWATETTDRVWDGKVVLRNRFIVRPREPGQPSQQVAEFFLQVPHCDDDAALIAATRNALPKLLAVVEATSAYRKGSPDCYCGPDDGECAPCSALGKTVDVKLAALEAAE